MLLQKEDEDYIKKAFSTIETIVDLLSLLNFSKKKIYRDNDFKEITLRQLYYYASNRSQNKKYSEKTILKKSGKVRIINIPTSGLKTIQRCLNLIFQTVYQPHPSAFGFIPKRCITDNARIHTGKIYVYNIDLKDFFTSIDQARIWKRIQSPPFKLKPEIANIIAPILCVHLEVERQDSLVYKNVLPQGAPTSPTISNIICERLDIRLSGVAKRFGLTYSRYADDLTFSSNHNVYQMNKEFETEIKRIILDQGFHINDSKTRLQKTGYRQEVTGLIVNEKINVRKHYVKKIRKWLHCWEKYGQEKAYSYFLKSYKIDKGHVKIGTPNMSNVIEGKLNFLKQVKGAEDNTFISLQRRYYKLIKYALSTEKLLNIWNIQGINQALKYVYDKEIYHKHEFIKYLLERRNSTGDINTIRNYLLNEYEKNISEQEKDTWKKDSLIGCILNEPRKSGSSIENINLSLHNPIAITELLTKFRTGYGLKYLTHRFDVPGQEFEIDKIIETSKKEFYELLKDNLFIKQSLYARIVKFAFGEGDSDYWSFNGKRYFLNWCSKEMSDWLRLNPGKHPLENTKFEKELINPFKDSIEIKSSSFTTLRELILQKLTKVLGEDFILFKDNIELVNLEKANFFTDVDTLLKGIETIIATIKQRKHLSNKIKIEFSRKGRVRQLKIIHVGAKSDKKLLKSDLFGGDFTSIEKNLYQVCDWSIIVDSSVDEYNVLNILFNINSNTRVSEKNRRTN